MQLVSSSCHCSVGLAGPQQAYLLCGLVLFCFVEFQFAVFLVRLFSCGGCKSQEGPCRPGRNVSLQEPPSRGAAPAQPGGGGGS